jgi:hypothetical protein
MLYSELIAGIQKPDRPARSLFKDKTYLCYVGTQSIPRFKHSILVITTKLLMLYKAKAAVCSVNNSTDCNHHVEFLNVKPDGT